MMVDFICRIDPEDPQETFDRLGRLAEAETCPHVSRGAPVSEESASVVAFDSPCLKAQLPFGTTCGKQASTLLWVFISCRFEHRSSLPSRVGYTITSTRADLFAITDSRIINGQSIYDSHRNERDIFVGPKYAKTGNVGASFVETTMTRGPVTVECLVQIDLKYSRG